MSDAVQSRLPDVPQPITPPERSASPLSTDSTHYPTAKRSPRSEPMDISSSDSSDEGTPEPYRSARTWATLYAKELGHPTLLDAVCHKDVPVLIWSHGRVSRPTTYSFDDFMNLQDCNVVGAVLGMMQQHEKNKYPSTTFFVDENYKRGVIKDRLRRAFAKRFQPMINFAGDVEEIWTMDNVAEDAKQAEETPIWNPKKRTKYTSWTSANLEVPSFDKVKEAINFADRFYKDDDDKIIRIRKIIVFASNFANCMFTTQKLRDHVKDPSLINTFEILVNLMHTQLHFQDSHSVLTFASLIVDVTVRLISAKFEHWMSEVVRITTSGLKRESQDLNWKRSLHVGLIFPNDDLTFKARSNSQIIRDIEDKAHRIATHTTIDFQIAMETRAACDELLYVNDWTHTCDENETYMDDVLSLVEKGKEIFNMDPPQDRTESAVKNGDNKRTLLHAGSTHTLHYCNNLRVNAEGYRADKSLCLYCGTFKHHTSDHFGYKFEGPIPARGARPWDMDTITYGHLDSIQQSRKRHTFQTPKKKIGPADHATFSKVVAQHPPTAENRFPQKWINGTLITPVQKKEKKITRPLSRITPQQPVASTSQQTIDEEDNQRPRQPRFTARGEAIRRFQSTRKNKKKSQRDRQLEDF